MKIEGNAQQLWIFVGEKDRWRGKPLYLAILEVLQRRGCAGATVFRGLAGFGANSLIHTVLLLELSTDLPIVITAVDRQDRLRRVLPEIGEMVQEGMITLTPVEVVKYTHRIPGAFPPGLTAGEVMTHHVVKVLPDAPVSEALKKLLSRHLGALPVVDAEGKALGWITEEDLLVRVGSDLPASITSGVAELGLSVPRAEGGQTAAEIMTGGVETVGLEDPIPEAAARMAEGNLKRLAVVDGSGHLAGILSRSDILKTVADALEGDGGAARPQVDLTATVREAMRLDGPVVGLETPLPEVLDRLLASPSREVIVVDADRRVAGIITESDILSRAGEPARPEVLRALAAWLRGGKIARGLALTARGKMASQVMTHPVVSVPAAAPVSEALRIMIERRIKLLPVVDEEGRLAGTLDRSALLSALARVNEGKLEGERSAPSV